MEIKKVTLIFIKNRKMMATIAKGKDKFYFPGGKNKPVESDEEALIREIKEELSVQIIKESIEYYGTFKAQAHGKPENTMVVSNCYTAQFNGEIKPDNEIEKIIWVDSSDIDRATDTGRLILKDLKGKGLIG